MTFRTYLTPEGPRLNADEKYERQPDFVTEAFSGGSPAEPDPETEVKETLKAAQAQALLEKSVKESGAATQADAVQITSSEDDVVIANAADVVKEAKRTAK